MEGVMSLMGSETKVIRRYSESLKMQVVEEVESGRLTTKEAADFYDISHARTVNRWVRKFGKAQYRTKVVRVIMKSEQERIRELESALSDALLGRRVLAAQLESYEGYVPDLKKRLSGKELKEFEERQKKIEQFR
jgi:transposase-like protein